MNGRVFATKPLNYLGFTFDGEHKRIRSSSIARFYKKMRLGVARAKAVRSRVDRRDGISTPLRLRKLHLLYTYIGRHNFPAYVYRAARIMHDPGIKRQIKRHWRKFQSIISNP